MTLTQLENIARGMRNIQYYTYYALLLKDSGGFTRGSYFSKRFKNRGKQIN